MPIRRTQMTTARGNACDTDDDNDSVPDSSDAFPFDKCAGADSDSDSLPDALVADCDTELIADNCPNAANAEQTDTDSDSQGDACDTDDDNDSVPDSSDAFPLDKCASADSDSDGLPDALVSSCDTELIADNCPMAWRAPPQA